MTSPAPRKPTLLIRLCCLVYWLVLTVLLLVPEPQALLAIERSAEAPELRGVHFLVFAGLTFLVHAGRWPIRRGLLVALLLAYAIGIEALQVFIPERTVDPLDFLENALAVAAAAHLWRFMQRSGTRRR